MKNIIQICRLLFVLSAFFLPHTSFSQTSRKDYEIIFKTQNYKDKYLYLIGTYANKPEMMDSAKFVKNQYVFKSSKQDLPAGFYTIQTQSGEKVAEFLIDQTRKFTIEDAEKDMIFINSNENIVFQQFKKDLCHGNDLRIYTEVAPESLLAKYILAQYIPMAIAEFQRAPEDREAAAKRYYQFYIDHYFDNIDFKDIRLMRTPLDVDLKDFFTLLLFPQTPDNVIANIKNLFHQITDENPTQEQLDVKDFYLKKLIHLYMTADSKFDTVFVFLVDNYITKTNTEIISESERNVFKRMADRKRVTLVGNTIPVFESFTKDHFKISTADLPAKYTILWFWDPDCEHCIENTPQLYEFYSKYQNLYDFNVIACSVTEDYDRWIAFINRYNLDWYNTSYAIEEPNYDAVDYFNFNDTPAIFIIDKEHTIVARQFPVEDLIEVFESLHNE